MYHLDFANGGATGFLPVFILWPTFLVSQTFGKDISSQRAFGGGILVGCAALFRYDMGAGLLVCHTLTIAIGVGLRSTGLQPWLRSMVRNLWAYATALALIVAPLAWAYLRAASLRDMLFDTVVYTQKYYILGRRMAFPNPRDLKQVQELLVYLVVIVAAVGIIVAGQWVMQRRQRNTVDGGTPFRVGILVAFSLVVLMLFAKASVRIASGSVFPALPECAIMTAVLYDQRAKLGGVLRGTAILLAVGLFGTGAWASLHTVLGDRKTKTSTLLGLLEPATMPPHNPYKSWCTDNTPVTQGICFFMDDDHIQTVEFLMHHTKPGDTLYVGLPQHDRILMNDNMTYFATQRLPATKWSHFEPYLQNSLETQQHMVADLTRNKPPYVVLDKEFDASHGPNGSSVHTGVHLLDDYIAQNYRPVKTFSELEVLERIN